MTPQFIILLAIASAINDRPQRKLDSVEEERRIFQEQLNLSAAEPAARKGAAEPLTKTGLAPTGPTDGYLTAAVKG